MININFIHYRKFKRLRSKKWFLFFYIASITTIIIINLSIYNNIHNRLIHLNRASAKLTNESNKIVVLKAQAKKEHKKIQAETNTVNLIILHRNQNISMLNKLIHISNFSLQNIKFESLNINDKTLNLRGIAKSYSALQQLKKYFSDARFYKIKENIDHDNLIKFVLRSNT